MDRIVQHADEASCADITYVPVHRAAPEESEIRGHLSHRLRDNRGSGDRNPEVDPAIQHLASAPGSVQRNPVACLRDEPEARNPGNRNGESRMKTGNPLQTVVDASRTNA